MMISTTSSSSAPRDLNVASGATCSGVIPNWSAKMLTMAAISCPAEPEGPSPDRCERSERLEQPTRTTSANVQRRIWLLIAFPSGESARNEGLVHEPTVFMAPAQLNAISLLGKPLSVIPDVRYTIAPGRFASSGISRTGSITSSPRPCAPKTGTPRCVHHIAAQPT